MITLLIYILLPIRIPPVEVEPVPESEASPILSGSASGMITSSYDDDKRLMTMIIIIVILQSLLIIFVFDNHDHSIFYTNSNVNDNHNVTLKVNEIF